jgi:type III secretion system (T3SS) SseB-like protein
MANPVEAALTGLRSGTSTPDHLLSALSGNTLWVPLPGGVEPGGRALLPVMVLDGKPYVAAYSSAEEYARGAGNQPHMELTGKELAALMEGSLGLALNPGGELGLPVQPDGVRVIRGERRSVRLGQPAIEPVELLDTLKTAFADEPAVLAARRALAQQGEEPPVLVIGVLPDRTVSLWENAVREALGRQVFVFLDDDNDPVARWMNEHTTPFYER